MQCHGHLKGSNRVHVSSDDGNTSVTAFWVSESKAAHQIHLTNKSIKERRWRMWEREKGLTYDEKCICWQSAIVNACIIWIIKAICHFKCTLIKQTPLYLTTGLERAAFGTEQHILEVEFDVVLDARHGCCYCICVCVKTVSLHCVAVCPLCLLFV